MFEVYIPISHNEDKLLGYTFERYDAILMAAAYENGRYRFVPTQKIAKDLREMKELF